MDFAEIERILGTEASQRISDAVAAAGAAAGAHPSGPEALGELLVAMLAAALITPRSGAVERVEQAKLRLAEIVDTALQLGND